MTQMRQNFLHTINPRCSIDDIELLAKYVYCRKNSENVKNGSVDSSISFRDLNDGLKTCFVDRNGKMKSFKDIHIYLKNHLGFSSFMNDSYFAYVYLCDLADNLNITCSVDYLNEIKSFLESEKPNQKIVDIIQKLFEELKSLAKNEYLNKDLNNYPVIPNDKFSFLYDLLYYRKEITNYHCDVKSRVDVLIDDIKSSYSKLSPIEKYAIMYSVIFFALYQKNETFFGDWKYYFPAEHYKALGLVKENTDNKFIELSNFASKMTNLLKEHGLILILGTNEAKVNLHIYPCIVFLEMFQDKFKIKEGETLNNFFLRHTKGGRIITTDTLLSHIFHHSPFNTLEPPKNSELHNVIDSLRYINLSHNILRTSSSARPRFQDFATLPLYIYKLLLKCWLYYKPNNTQEDVLNIIKPYFSYHFYNSSLFKDTHHTFTGRSAEENFMLKDYFESPNTNYSSSDLSERVIEYFRRKNSKISKDFFDEYYQYEYCYIEKILETNVNMPQSSTNTKIQNIPLYKKLQDITNDEKFSCKSYISLSKQAFHAQLNALI